MTSVRKLLHGDTNPFMGCEMLPLDLQGWNSESPVFERLIRELKPTRICEVGTWKGASAIHMSRLLPLDIPAEIVCVDTWLGSLEFYLDPNKRGLLNVRNGRPAVYETFLSNVVRSGQAEVIVPCPMPSLMASTLFWNSGINFDLIYIDASHTTEDVIADITHYASFAPVLFGDDWDWAEVREGVQRAAEILSLCVETENEKWILRR